MVMYSEIQKYEDNSFWQLIQLKNRLLLITLRSTGTVDKPELLVNIKPDDGLNNRDIHQISKIVTSIFNLDFNLLNFYNDMKNDGVMSQLIVKLKGLNSPTTTTFFEAIVSSIIEQQISLKAAKSIENRMIKDFGNELRSTIKPIIYSRLPKLFQISIKMILELLV